MFTHAAVREWEANLAPVLTETLRKPRRGRVGRRWYCDETYLKVRGHWTSLYRAIERDGNRVDVSLSETRDRAAAEAFFRSTRTVTEVVPDRVTTDGHDSYPGASMVELGEAVTHRTNRDVTNHREQAQRGIKQRTHPRCGVKSCVAAARCCRVSEEVRNFFRARSPRNESGSVAWQRAQQLGRMGVLMAT